MVLGASIKACLKDPLLCPYRYFKELSSQLFRILLDAASSEDKILTIDMIEGVGLDPIKDRGFLVELAHLYRPCVTIQHSTDMFSCCL